jgi:hypothetical protein
VHDLVQNDSKLTFCEMGKELEISYGSYYPILNEDLATQLKKECQVHSITKTKVMLVVFFDCCAT